MFSDIFRSKTAMVEETHALPGRTGRPALAARHLVLDAPLVTDEVPARFEVALFGLGCFWGAEEIFWQVPGVWSTSVGYAGGYTRVLKAGYRYGDNAPLAVIEFVDRDVAEKGKDSGPVQVFGEE